MEILGYKQGPGLGWLQGSTLSFALHAEGSRVIVRELRTGCRIPLLSHISPGQVSQCFALFQPKTGIQLFPRLLGGGLCCSREGPSQLTLSELENFLSRSGDPFDYAHCKGQPCSNQSRAFDIAQSLVTHARAGDVQSMRLAELEDLPQVSVPAPYPILQCLLTALAQPALWTLSNGYLVRFHLSRLARRYLTDHIFLHRSSFFRSDLSDLQAQIEEVTHLANNRDQDWPESGSLMHLTLMSRLIAVDKDAESWWKSLFRYTSSLLEPYTSLYPTEAPPHLASVSAPPMLSLVGKKHLLELTLLLDEVYFCLGSLRCPAAIRSQAVTVLSELLASRDDFTMTYMTLACLEWAIHRGKLDESELRRLGILVEDLLNASTLSHNFRLCEVLASLLVKLCKSDQLTHLLDRATFQQVEFDQRIMRLLSLAPEELCVEPPYSNVPKARILVGREEELDQAKRQLLARRIVTIAGQEGVGKTALACQLANELRNGYYVVWLCDARTESTLAASLQCLAQRLGLDSPTSLLPHLNSPKVLLLLDDLAHRLTLQTQCLLTCQAYVIITAQKNAPEFAIYLGVLDPATSLQYLCSVSNRASEHSDLAILCQELGGLPLALELAVSLLHRQSTQSLLDCIRSSPETSPESEATAVQLIGKCIELVSEQAQALLRIVALLAPEGLPMQLIQPLFCLLQPAGNLQSAQQELVEALLLREVQPCHLSVPSLVRTTLENCTPQPLLQSLFHCFVSVLAQAFHPFDLSPTSHPLAAAVEQAISTIQDLEEVTEDMFRLTIHYLVRYMELVGTFTKVADLFCLCVTWYEDFFKQSSQAGEYMDQFSALCLKAGQFGEAEVYAETALSVLEAQDQDGSALYARALRHLAAAQQAQGRLADAEKWSKAALETQLQVAKAEDGDLAEVYLVLAGVLLAKRSISEALSLTERALHLHYKAHSTDTSLAPAYLLLSSIAQAQGRLSEAESLAQRCKDLLEPLVGPYHPQLAAAYLALAGLYQAEKRLQEAEHFSLKALLIQQTLYGESHPLLNPVLASLSMLYTALGKLAEAEKYASKRLSIQEASLGGTHPLQAPLYFELAQLLYGQRKLPEAETYALNALHLQETSLPRTHPQFAQTYSLIASILLERQKPQQAEKFALDALYTQEALHGRNDPEVAECYGRLAVICAAQGRVQDALDFATDAVKIRKKGKRDAGLAKGYVELAEICVKGEKLEKGEKNALKAIRILSNFPDSQVQAKATGLLISIYTSQSRLSEAEKYYVKALALVEATSPRNSQELALGYQSLASVCRAQGKHNEAGKYAIKARQLVP